MEESLLTPLLLGIVEGLTEFLPVSSTGHLVLGSTLLGFEGEGSAAFKIAIQMGAILAVVVVYWRRFLDAGLGVLRGDSTAIAFTRNILLGFLPAMLLGVIVYEAVRAMLSSPILVAVNLVVGGVAILLIERMQHRATILSVETMGTRTALAIGLVQCIAMIPGVSRSGATILGALLMGVERKTAAEYSFFLAVPTMLGATVYALWKSRDALGQGAWSEIAIGFTAAFLVAIAIVRWFVGVVSRHGFAPFAWYRIVVGSIALVWLLSI
ncbi:MAG: undecaprenyl-diphosphate phosphatase [Sphingomonadaceae bacterium]